MLFSFVPFTLFIALQREQILLRPNQPGLVAVRCVSIFGSMVCAFYAFKNLQLAQAYALIFAAPLLITILAIPVLKERVKWYRWMAVVIGFLGVVIVLNPGTQELTLGHAAGLAAALFSATTAVITRKIGNRESSLTLIVYPLLVNLSICALAMVWVYQPMSGRTLATMCSIGLLAVLGQALLIYAYRNAPAQFIAPFQYSQMLWAVIIGALFFDESPGSNVWLGSLVIVLSGVMIVWRELTASATRPILNTRNFRAVSGPAAYSAETDQNSHHPQTKADDK